MFELFVTNRHLDGGQPTNQIIQGRWNIDYAWNGFGVWDASYLGYGGAENIPVPADYDGDQKADFAVWAMSGTWNGTFDVDFAYNGFGTWDTALHRIFPGPGRPAAGEFNGDCLTDFGVKTDDGSWHLLLNGNTTPELDCFGGFFLIHSFATYYGYGGSLNRPVPADYDGDRFTDLAVRAEVEPYSFAVDYFYNGYGTWDAVFHP